MQQLKFDKCVVDAGVFLQKFGVVVNPLDDEEMAQLRSSRQKEEVQELKDAITLSDAADAIIDIAYIAAGTVFLVGDRAVETERLGRDPYLVVSQIKELFNRATWLGRNLPLQDLWDEVHKANMKKVRGTELTSKHGSAFDVVKPQGWLPPDIDSVLRKAKLDPLQHQREFFKK